MSEENCENCKFHIGDNKAQMWCARHAPVVIANPNYRETCVDRVCLSMQPETFADAYCGDWEKEENE